MSKRIVWDAPGERRFETGVDRGVLYLPDGRGVPWNGLTAVEEDNSDITTTSYHFDGIKYMDTRYPGDFSALLRAFTYPDEFLEFDGLAELANGVLLGNQPVYSRFGLSYRTKIGNDVDGIEHGYKIHILYNLVATPENRSYAVMGEQTNPETFSWKITGVPETIAGHRPTVHIVLDTTRLNPFLVRDIEDLLYGKDTIEVPVEETTLDGGTPEGNTETPHSDIVDGGTPLSPGVGILDGGTPQAAGPGIVDGSSPVTVDPNDMVDGGSPETPGFGVVDGGTPRSPYDITDNIEFEPRLPPLEDLVELINSWVLVEVIDNGDGTWTATGPDEYIRMLDATTFEIDADATFIDDDTYEISTTHSF